MDSTTLTMNKS